MTAWSHYPIQICFVWKNRYQRVLCFINSRGMCRRDYAQLKVGYIRECESSHVMTQWVDLCRYASKASSRHSYPASPTLAQRLSGNSCIHGSGSTPLSLMTQLSTLSQVLMSDIEARNCWRAGEWGTNKQRNAKGSLLDIKISYSLRRHGHETRLQRRFGLLECI